MAKNNNIAVLFALFQRHKSIQTAGHSKACYCGFCLCYLNLCSDGSGCFSTGDGEFTFSFVSISDGIAQFKAILEMLEAILEISRDAQSEVTEWQITL